MTENKDELWVVEVRKGVSPPGTKPLYSEWHRIAECGDSETAIAVTDALYSLKSYISDNLQVRTRVTACGRC